MVAPVSARVTELDGIRGIAVLLILITHFSFAGPPGILTSAATLGWVGVELFFVLSGCLITGILLHVKDSPDYFRTFYTKRALRIFPLYFAAIAFTFWIALPLARRAGLPHDWTLIPPSEQVWYWLHISNWRTAFGHYATEPIGQYWSLAIEEQFYLLWPLVVFLCSEKRLLRVALLIALASFALRNAPFLAPVQAEYPQFLYRLTPTHIDGLAIGACIPLVMRNPALLPVARRVVNIALVICGAASALVISRAQSMHLEDPVLVSAGYGIFAWTFGALLLRTVLLAGSGDPLCWIFRSRFLCSFGAYSYAIYVLHPLYVEPVRAISWSILPHGYWPALSIGAGMLISYGVGFCSWHLLEKRFIQRKDRLTYRRTAETHSDRAALLNST
jgi:peptidoglycan/LPS O-acetylase OafA/YrhL